MLLHRAAFTQTEAFTQSSLYAEAFYTQTLLPRAAFVHKKGSFHAGQPLHTGACPEKAFTQISFTQGSGSFRWPLIGGSETNINMAPAMQTSPPKILQTS